jgi:hypothetical protein
MISRPPKLRRVTHPRPLPHGAPRSGPPAPAYSPIAKIAPPGFKSWLRPCLKVAHRLQYERTFPIVCKSKVRNQLSN